MKHLVERRSVNDIRDAVIGQFGIHLRQGFYPVREGGQVT